MKFLWRILEKWADSVDEQLPSHSKHVPGYLISDDWCRYRRRSHCWFSRQVDEEATRVAGYQVFDPQDRGLCTFNSWEEQKACPVSEPGSNIAPTPDPTWRWSEGGFRVHPVIQVFPSMNDSPRSAVVNPNPGHGTSFVEVRSRGDLLELAARYRIPQNHIFEVNPVYSTTPYVAVNVEVLQRDALDG